MRTYNPCAVMPSRVLASASTSPYSGSAASRIASISSGRLLLGEAHGGESARFQRLTLRHDEPGDETDVPGEPLDRAAGEGHRPFLALAGPQLGVGEPTTPMGDSGRLTRRAKAGPVMRWRPSASIACSAAGLSRLGLLCRRDERSIRTASPSPWLRSRHLRPALVVTPLAW
jgi:hypothetical protein